jgi:16S rRNA (cytosine1402-N4)-methyltransferase
VSDAHAPVLLTEAIDALNVRPSGLYVDGTFGRGGHSRLLLERLGPEGRVIALDRDPEAVRAAADIRDPRFSIRHGAFGRIAALFPDPGLARVDGILLDLGISSPQIDRAERGFSFRHDAPLDMRMDTSTGRTAAEWLATADESEIREVIRDYGEERFAKQIAAAIVAARARGAVDSTRQLAEIVAEAVPTREPRQDPATRTFQAVRIHVNQELQELSLALPQCLELLGPGGRLAVISFHSLEDRIVKRFFRAQSRADTLPPRLAVRASELPEPALRIVGRAQKPSESEVAANPRARSAIMRVAERTSAALRPATASTPGVENTLAKRRPPVKRAAADLSRAAA